MGEHAESLRRAAYAGLVFVGVVGVGTVGFAAVGDEGIFGAFYRTVITISTAGLVTAPDSVGEKVLTASLVLSGVAIFLYVFGLVIELIVSGSVSGALQERRIGRRVQRLDGHYVICGYGRMGRRVAEEFRVAGVDHVVVDSDLAAVEKAREDGHLVLHGDASEDEDLSQAGVQRARGLVTAVGDDADNLYIVLTAKGLRPELLVVARASDEEAAKKLLRAGADRTVSPYATAGREMASMVLRPQVAALLDVFTSAGTPAFRLEEIEVTEASGQTGKSVRELNVRETTGAMIIAHKRRGGEFDTRPDPDKPLEAGDILIGVGTPEEIHALEELFRPREALAR